MSETELASLWSALEPSSRRRARIETRVFDWIEAGETSIAGEWLRLLKVDPVSALAYASAGAASLLLMTPAGWMLVLLLA